MKIKTDIRFIGIRHHGPGCARDLKQFLHNFQPNLILMEFPENIKELLISTDIDNIKPPAAILLYKQGDATKTFVLPFASFSPEWIALSYAKANQIPIEPIDLPIGVTPIHSENNEVTDTSDFPLKNSGEAFKFLSELQGITDIEHWWEINFEQTSNPSGNFNKIEEIINAIRPALEAGSDSNNKVREAFMRLKIKEYIKLNTYQKIVVITGAAHLPFVKEYDSFTVKEDKTITKLMHSEKLTCDWIPWSYQRLSSLNNYGAGIEFPKYYEHIYLYGSGAPITITSTLSSLLRKKGYDISLAHTLEAVNLAQTLATLRGWEIPDISTIIESCSAVYNLEQKPNLQSLIQEAFIGNDLGSVPVNTENQALIQDFWIKIKEAKLFKYTKDSSEYELTLDLRDTAQLNASSLLWRLRLLGIEWGTPANPFSVTKGTFKEFWNLNWKSEYLIILFHHCIYGSNIESAALNTTINELKKSNNINLLQKLLTAIINSQINELTTFFFQTIENTLFKTEEYKSWFNLTPQLCFFYNYGSVRSLESAKLLELINIITQRLNVNMDTILYAIPDDQQEDDLESIIKINSSLKNLNIPQLYIEWIDSLAHTANNYNTPAIFRGWITGICVESKKIELSEAFNKLSQELSDLDHLDQSTLWLHGFLQSQALSPFAVPSITKILDLWLSTIEFNRFRLILPSLRKSFSEISMPLKESFKIYTGKQKPALEKHHSHHHINAELAQDFKEYINSFLVN